MILFLEYPKCSTCQKAKKWLQDNHISFTCRHIVTQNPSADELATWMQKAACPLKRFFNTSGLMYKSLDLKNKLPVLSATEQLSLLASNGMLVKRPLLITNDTVLIGFKPTEWERVLK